ncbi:MAG: hypothetical protein KTR31_18525 [Myxococcales bacterium]|nr:hypothetical protein [Myxococcales bacterium]
MSPRPVLVVALSAWAVGCACPDHSGLWMVQLMGDATGSFDLEVLAPDTSVYGDGAVEATVASATLDTELFTLPFDQEWFLVSCDGLLRNGSVSSAPFALTASTSEVVWQGSSGVDALAPISFCLTGSLDAESRDGSGEWEVKTELHDCDSGSTPAFQGRWSARL